MARIHQILKKKIIPIARFLLLVPVDSQKYRKILIFSYFHMSTCDQIWLNHFQDDSHLGYITKLKKETLPWTIPKTISKITTSFFKPNYFISFLIIASFSYELFK
jgi:hypothetical protein